MPPRGAFATILAPACMTQTEPPSSTTAAVLRPLHTRWDALVAAVLGAALLAAGWLDVRSYLGHLRDAPPPDFAFLDPEGFEPIDDGVCFRRANAFAWLEHVGGLESNKHQRFRHTFGPRSELVVHTPGTLAHLHFELENSIPDQDLTVTCNGQTVEQLTRLPPGKITRTYALTLRPGFNEITLAFARFNHGGADLAPEDGRPISGTLLAFDLALH